MARLLLFAPAAFHPESDMNHTTWLALVAAMGLVPAARAATVEASATTVLIARPQASRGVATPTAPLLELVDVSAKDIDWGPAQDVRVKLSAWGRWHVLGGLSEGSVGSLRGPSAQDPLGADLQLLYAEARVLDRRLHVRAGRQLIFDGATPRVVHVDGASLDFRIARGFGVRAYGGAPVVPLFGPRPADVQTGARVYYSPSFGNELGASYTYGFGLETFGAAAISRHEVGLDGRWAVRRDVLLTAAGIWSVADSRLVEAELMPRWFVRPDVELYAHLRRTAPDLWLPRTSILSVFADDERDEWGGGVYWAPMRRLSLTADGRYLRMVDGSGHDVRARGTYRLGFRNRAQVGAEVRQLRIPENGYVLGRVFATHRITEQLFVAGDADVYFLDAPINGETTSVAASASVGWRFLPGWRATVSGVAGADPTFARRFELLARVGYQFATTSRSRGDDP